MGRCCLRYLSCSGASSDLSGLKAPVPKEAYDQWTEAVNDPSKRADVKAFYIKGMVKDDGGKVKKTVVFY